MNTSNKNTDSNSFKESIDKFKIIIANLEDESVTYASKIKELEEKVEGLESLAQEKTQKAIIEIFKIPSQESNSLSRKYYIQSIVISLIITSISVWASIKVTNDSSEISNQKNIKEIKNISVESNRENMTKIKQIIEDTVNEGSIKTVAGITRPENTTALILLKDQIMECNVPANKSMDFWIDPPENAKKIKIFSWKTQENTEIIYNIGNLSREKGVFNKSGVISNVNTWQYEAIDLKFIDRFYVRLSNRSLSNAWLKITYQIE
jgi:hypothetical protein